MKASGGSGSNPGVWGGDGAWTGGGQCGGKRTGSGDI